MFFVALRRMGMEGLRPANSEDFLQWFLRDGATVAASTALGKGRWSDARERFLATAPKRDEWDSELQEVPLRDFILTHFRSALLEDEASDLYVAAARLLMLVAARDDHAVDPYSDCPLPPNYDFDYPVTLRTLRRASDDTLPELKVKDALGWFVTEWGLRTHLMVALRKLRHTSKSTFRVLPTDRGLELQPGEIVPAPTSPRLNQALQISEDLGLVRSSAEFGLALTAEGQRVLDYGLAH
jgi:hypothetical protein